MKIFVDAFGKLLSRGQIKYLIIKLENDKLIEHTGTGRNTLYCLNKGIDTKQDIIVQFVEHLLQ